MVHLNVENVAQLFATFLSYSILTTVAIVLHTILFRQGKILKVSEQTPNILAVELYFL